MANRQTPTFWLQLGPELKLMREIADHEKRNVSNRRRKCFVLQVASRPTVKNVCKDIISLLQLLRPVESLYPIRRCRSVKYAREGCCCVSSLMTPQRSHLGAEVQDGESAQLLFQEKWDAADETRTRDTRKRFREIKCSFPLNRRLFFDAEN